MKVYQNHKLYKSYQAEELKYADRILQDIDREELIIVFNTMHKLWKSKNYTKYTREELAIWLHILIEENNGFKPFPNTWDKNVKQKFYTKKLNT